MENSKNMGGLFSGSDMLEGKFIIIFSQAFSVAFDNFSSEIFAVPGLCTTPMLQREAYEVRLAAEETPRNPAIFALDAEIRNAAQFDLEKSCQESAMNSISPFKGENAWMWLIDVG